MQDAYPARALRRSRSVRAMTRWVGGAALLAWTATAAAAPPLHPPGEGSSFADEIDQLRPTVVNVQATQVSRKKSSDALDDFFDRFFNGGGGGGERRRSLGSGFIFDSSGLVLTNDHVVKDARDVRVRLSDDREFQGDVVGRDPKTDVALIRLRGANNLPAATLGDSESIRVGDWVLAIGNPFGLGNTVTQGIVSAKERVVGAGPYDDFIQTDASINPGNSGGPLFDLSGRVIGVNTAIVAGGQGIGFAIPINLVKVVAEQLQKNGRVTRGYIGVEVQEVTPPLASALGLPRAEGALVGSVESGGPAARAGLRAGDVIVEWNGHAVQHSGRLPLLVAETAPGTRARVGLIRDRKRTEVNVTVVQMQDHDEESQATTPAAAHTSNALGVELRDLTPEVRRGLGLPAQGGAVVVRVDPDGRAAGQLQAGDVILEVNRSLVRGSAEARRKISAARGAVLLRVRRKDSLIYVGLPGKS
jgi:serine protease Do